MDSDEKLIADYLAGNEKALDALIQRHVRHVYNFAYQFVKDRGLAEDIAQETFIKVWKNAKRFNPQKRFLVWLLQITRNSAIDFLRKKKDLHFSDLETGSEEEGRAFDVPDSALTPQEIFEKKEIVTQVQSFIQELPLIYREVLALYYQNNLTFQEISQTSGISIDTLKSRHRRALILLKHKLISGTAPKNNN